MKKASSIIALVFAFLSVAAQSNDQVYDIKAFLPGWKGSLITLTIDDNLVSSSQLQNDVYSYTGIISSPKQALLQIKKDKQTVFVPFFVEKGTIKVRDAGNRQLIPYNTQSNDEYFRLTRYIDSLAALQKGKNFDEIVSFKRALATAYIQQNFSSIISARLLREYYYLQQQADDTLYYQLVLGLDKSLQQQADVKKMIAEAVSRNATAIGRQAPLMPVQDTAGVAMKIYDTGHYTLIDFWASWCLPCRKENKQLLSVYQKYYRKGFRVTGISLDTNKHLWLNAIKQDKIYWTQLSDLKGWESAAVHSYGIKVIPMNFLVDKSGVILAKNIYPNDLDQILNRVLQ